MGDEAGQGLQGGAQRIQAALKGGQAGLELLVLGVQLGHEVIQDILGLPETEQERKEKPSEREGGTDAERDRRPAPVRWEPTKRDPSGR